MLFLKEEKVLCSTYQYGKVEAVEQSHDGKVRKVHVKYRNNTEETDRITYRSARNLVIIHPVDELSIMEEMGQVAAKVDAENILDLNETLAYHSFSKSSLVFSIFVHAIYILNKNTY